MNEAAETIGLAKARVTLPEYPPECSKQYGPIPVREGYEAVVAIKRGDQLLAASNRDKVTCAVWYKKLATELANPKP